MSTRNHSRRPTLTQSRVQNSRMSINPSGSRRTVISISDQKLENDKKQARKQAKVRDHVNVTDENGSIVTPAKLFVDKSGKDNSSGGRHGDRGHRSNSKNTNISSATASKRASILTQQGHATPSNTTNDLINNGSAMAVKSSNMSQANNNNATTNRRGSSIVTAYASELFGTLRSTNINLDRTGVAGQSDFMSLASSLYQGGIGSSTTKMGNMSQSQAQMSTSNLFASMERKESIASSQSNTSLLGSRTSRPSVQGVPSMTGPNTANSLSQMSLDVADLRTDTEKDLTSSDTKLQDGTNLSEDQLETACDVIIQESEVFYLLDLKGTLFSLENDDEVKKIEQENQTYEDLCLSREGNDKFAERSMQTCTNAAKSRHIQCEAIGLKSVACEATIADIYDDNLNQEILMKSKNLLPGKAGAASVAVAGLGGSGGNDLDNNEDLDAVLEDFIDDETKKQAAAGADGKGGIGVTADATADPFASNTSQVALLSTVQGSFVQFDHPKSSENQKKMVAERIKALQIDGILKSAAFTDSLSLIERMLSLNEHQDALAKYRQLFNKREKAPIVEVVTPASKAQKTRPPVIEEPLGAKQLFSYLCPSFFETKNIPKTVTSIALNKKNPDLIAVGYGYFTSVNDDQVDKFDTKSKHAAGVVCCWNIKNLSYPERVYTVPSGVTSLDFSKQNTNLLAVGCFNGSLFIYNVKTRSEKPIMDSSDTMAGIDSQRSGPKNQHGNNRHTSAIWHNEWIERGVGASGDEKHEHLVSIAADGRVTQWSIRKGFENVDLMKLKRVTGKGTAGAAINNVMQSKGKSKNRNQADTQANVPRAQKTEALISRQSPGITFAFHRKDANQYIVGTEEGKIHRCSCSYNEQYLETYHGHSGVVHKVIWSPHNTDVFLSASSDWTAKVWLSSDADLMKDSDHLEAAITLAHGSGNRVNDCAWHPLIPTVFVTLTDSDLRIFDLQQSCLDPIKIVKIIADFPQKGQIAYPKLTMCKFFPTDPCMSVLIGDENGNVTVYELEKFPTVVDVSKKKKNFTLEQIIKHARESLAK